MFFQSAVPDCQCRVLCYMRRETQSASACYFLQENECSTRPLDVILAIAIKMSEEGETVQRSRPFCVSELPRITAAIS